MSYNELYTTSLDSKYGEIRVLNSIDRFSMVDGYLNDVVENVRRSGYSSLHIIINSFGEVWAQQDEAFQLDQRRVDRNHVIGQINFITDLVDIIPTKDFLYNEQFKNCVFGDHLAEEILKYGLSNLYPVFYGIELSILPRTGFCQGISLVTIGGSDSQTLQNARVIMR